MIIQFIKNLFNNTKSNSITIENPSHIKIGNMVQFRSDNNSSIFNGISKFDNWKCTYVDIFYAFNEPCMILEFMEVAGNGLSKNQKIVKILHNEEVFYVHESDLVPIKHS